MREIILQMLDFLGSTGYYARSTQEKIILNSLVETGIVKLKRGTKNVYILANGGLKKEKEELSGKSRMSYNQFLKCVQAAYERYVTLMNPLVKIPDIWNSLESKVSRDTFVERLLDFHEQGVLTLHTAFSNRHGEGGIEARTKPGVYYYMTFDA